MSSAASNPSPKAVNKLQLKRNPDDIGWQYGVLVNQDDLNVIQCKLCPMVVRAGIYRLKLHIAGIKGQVRSCPNANPEDRENCKKAIEDSKNVKRSRILEQQEVRDAVTDDMMDIEDGSTGLDDIGTSQPRAVGPMDKFTMPMDSSSLGSSRNLHKQKISEHIKKERLHKLKRYIARWMYVQGIPFNAINCDEFDQVLEAAGRFGPGAKKPYQHELREKLLHEEVEDTKKMVIDHAQEWASTRCSIMTDAWTDQKRRSIMNMCVNSCVGTSFIESKEVSAEAHTGQMIFELVDGFIEKVGEERIVQVVTDNASNNMAAKDLLYVKRPHLFWSSCATHSINLMLEAIGRMKKFKTILDSAKDLTIFIYAHHKALSLMRKYTKKRDIIRPGVTRFASASLTLQSLYDKKEQLRMMSQSEEWEKISHVKKSTKGVQATATLVKPMFWNGVNLCLRVFEPLVQVLRMVDGDIKPSMAWVYGDILKAKEEIRIGLGNVDKTGAALYKSIIQIAEEKMKKRLDCPVHMAAYCLNRYYSYSKPSIFDCEDVMDGFIAAIETFYHGDYNKQSQVLNDDFHKFKGKLDILQKKVAQAGRKDYDFSPDI
ncbi:uncharacterized protein LOC112895392 [Panicum hallii]|uniref:uncharacterized protein LOC112895392 n=1 Tax=Panicum hallii TaxID=206008 RepID=UPI000DF4EBC4|nr:uncharacterized protein LOC112895392 [Panicum hallii]